MTGTTKSLWTYVTEIYPRISFSQKRLSAFVKKSIREGMALTFTRLACRYAASSPPFNLDKR